MFEEKEQQRPPPPSPTPSSPPSSSPSPSSPSLSVSGLLRSAHSLSLSLRHHQPVALDSGTSRYLRSSHQLLTRLADALQSAVVASSASQQSQALELRAVMAEQQRLLDAVKEEQTRRRRAERQCATHERGKASQVASGKEREEEARRRAEEAEAKLGGVRRRLELTVTDWRQERAMMDERWKAEHSKRSRLSAQLKASKARAHEAEVQLQALRAEVSQLQHDVEVGAVQRAELLEERAFLTSNRAEVLDANIRLMASTEQARMKVEELSEAKRGLEEEQLQSRLRSEEWTAQSEELRRLREGAAEYAGRTAQLDAQSQALSRLTVRMQEKTEQMDADYAREWATVKEGMREEMWTAVRAAENTAEEWRKRAEETQHSLDLQSVDMQRLQLTARETAKQVEQEKVEGERRSAKDARLVGQLEAEVRLARERETEAEERARQTLAQLRLSTDASTAEELQRRAEAQAHAAAMDEARGEALRLKEEAAEAAAELHRCQQRLTREAERGRLLSTELAAARSLHATFIDPVLHRSVQVDLVAAQAEVASLQRKVAEQSTAASSLQSAVERNEDTLNRRLEQSAEERRRVEGQLRALFDEKRRGELQAKEAQADVAEQLKEATARAVKAEGEVIAAVEEVERCKRGAVEAEQQRLSTVRDCDARIASLQSSLRQRSRHCQQLLRQQAEAQAKQAKAWEVDIADRVRQVTELQKTAEELQTRTGLLQALLAAAEKGALDARTKQAEAERDAALIEQDALAVQAQQAQAVQQLSAERQTREEDRRGAEAERAAFHVRLSSLQAEGGSMRSELQRAEHDAHVAQRDAVELRAAVELGQRRMAELRQRMAEVEEGRAAALERAAKAEAELQPLKEVEKDCEVRLSSFTAQMRLQADELTLLQRSSAEQLQAKDAALVEREEWLKEERRRRAEAETEGAKLREGCTREVERASALRAELDELRLLHSTFVSPVLHLELRQQLQRAEAEVAKLARSGAEWSEKAAALQTKLGATEAAESSLRSSTAAREAALHGRLRSAVSERRALELQVKELQVGFAAQQREMEEEADQQADLLSTTRTQLAAAAQQLSAMTSAQAEQQVEREREVLELRRQLRQQEADYQLLIQRQQTAQEEALTAWEVQLSLRAREVEQLTVELQTAEERLRVERERIQASEVEVSELQAALRAVQGEKLQQQRDVVEAHGRHLRALQLHVGREQALEAKERELQQRLLRQTEAAHELELRLSQLSACLRDVESRCDAELHERALQLADYSALVRRMAEEVRALQGEKERVREETRETLDGLMDDMRKEAVESEQRLSRTQSARPAEAETAAAARDLAAEKARSASLSDAVHSLSSSLSAVRAELQARSEKQRPLVSPRSASTMGESPAPLRPPSPRMDGGEEAEQQRQRSVADRPRLQVERLKAELVAEREWHEVTKASMEAFQRQQRPSAAARPSAVDAAEGGEEEEEKREAELDAASELRVEVADLRAALASKEQRMKGAQREAELLSSTLAQQGTDAAGIISQLTQRIAQLEGHQQPAASPLPPLSSPSSAPLNPRTSASPRASPRRFDRLKRPAWGPSLDDLDSQRAEWREEKEKERDREGSTAWLPSMSSSILHVHSLHSVDPAHPSLIHSSLAASAKASRRWSASLRSPLSPSAAGAPLSSLDQGEAVVHLHTELRLAAIDLEELQRQKAEAELRLAQREEEHRREQRQWMELLDQAATVNSRLQREMRSARGKQEVAMGADAAVEEQPRVAAEAEADADDGEGESDDGGLVTIEIEERLQQGGAAAAAAPGEGSGRELSPLSLPSPSFAVAAGGPPVAPQLMLSGRSAGGASAAAGGRSARAGNATSDATEPSSSRRQRGGGGGGGGAAAAGGRSAERGGDREDDGEDGDRPPRRSLSSVPSSSHYADSHYVKGGDWNKAADASSPFASRSSSPRLSTVAMERGVASAVASSPSPSSSTSSLLRINEELSARLSALEVDHLRLQEERERLLRSQEEAMERHRLETAEAIAEQQGQVRRLREQLNRSGDTTEGQSGRGHGAAAASESLQLPTAEHRTQWGRRMREEPVQSRRTGATHSSSSASSSRAAATQSTPSSRLPSPRRALDSASSSAPLPVPSSLQSTVESLVSTCRQQAEELQQLRAALSASKRSQAELAQQLQHHQPQHSGAAAAAALTPSSLSGGLLRSRPTTPLSGNYGGAAAHPSLFGADSRLLLSLQQSEAERLLQEGRLDAALLRVSELEEERQRLEGEVENATQRSSAAEDELDDVRARHAADSAAAAAREEEREAALASSRLEVQARESQLQEMDELLALQLKEAEGWKSVAEEREREVAAMVQREEESVDVMRQMEGELRRAEEAVTVAEGRVQALQRALEDSQREAAALTAMRAQADAAELRAQRRDEEEQQRRSTAEADGLQAQLRHQQGLIVELRMERDGLQAKMAQLSASGEAKRRSQSLLQEALQAQAATLEGLLDERKEVEGEEQGGLVEVGRLQAEVELQARTIEALLARQAEATQRIRAIGHEAAADDSDGDDRQRAGEEEEEQQRSLSGEEESKRSEQLWTWRGRGGDGPQRTVPAPGPVPAAASLSSSSSSPPSSPLSPTSSLSPAPPVEERLSAARETLRRMRELHDSRRARR